MSLHIPRRISTPASLSARRGFDTRRLSGLRRSPGPLTAPRRGGRRWKQSTGGFSWFHLIRLPVTSHSFLREAAERRGAAFPWLRQTAVVARSSSRRNVEHSERAARPPPPWPRPTQSKVHRDNAARCGAALLRGALPRANPNYAGADACWDSSRGAWPSSAPAGVRAEEGRWPPPMTSKTTGVTSDGWWFPSVLTDVRR